MDSITKLQSKLAEAENILKYVSKELNGYAQDKSVGSNLNFAEIKLRGEQYSFYEHPLKNQMFQDEYFALMIYVISLGGKKEEGWTILYRIAAGCDYQKDLQYLTTDAMTFTEERLSEIIRLIYSADMARTFAIDSLMICFHMGADDAQLQFLAGVYELLKIDKDFLTEAMEFVKVLDATYWDNPADKSKPWTILTAKDIATYIGGTPAASFDEAANLKKNRVIILNATHTGSSVLLLDEWNPNEILFLNCRFENCGGIYSANKVVKFLSCSFDQNGFVRFEKSSPKLEQYKKYRELYHFENAAFANCEFKHFNDATAYLFLNGGLISSCKFEYIKHTSNHYLVLFTINNSEVRDSQFINCQNSILHTNNMTAELFTSCLIYSENTRWQSNEFTACFNSFHVYARDLGYSYVLLLNKKSQCNDCLFNDVTTRITRIKCYYMLGGYDGDNYAETSVIGLRDSTAENNKDATVSKTEKIDLHLNANWWW